MRLRTCNAGAEMNTREKFAHAYKMRRTIEVQCTGECDIDEFSTDVLIDELRRRQKTVPEDDREELILAHEALCSRRLDQAQWILERLLWPKWKSVEECEKEMPVPR